MGFKDHFSRQSAAYGRYRPAYPPQLIEYVAAQAPGRRAAVDCATGNGQAAVALARHFGIVALWTYEHFRVDAAVDAVIDDFYVHVVGRDWPPERRYVEQGYRTLPFPWHELPAPAFALETDWELEQVMGYLATWSSVQRYKERTGEDPLPALEPRLAALWPRSVALRLRWPIHLRIGRA